MARLDRDTTEQRGLLAETLAAWRTRRSGRAARHADDRQGPRRAGRDAGRRRAGRRVAGGARLPRRRAHLPADLAGGRPRGARHRAGARAGADLPARASGHRARRRPRLRRLRARSSSPSAPSSATRRSRAWECCASRAPTARWSSGSPRRPRARWSRPARAIPTSRCAGPAPALIERVKDRYRFHVHVRSVRSALVRAALAQARAGRRIGGTRVADPRARRRGSGRHVLKAAHGSERLLAWAPGTRPRPRIALLRFPAVFPFTGASVGPRDQEIPEPRAQAEGERRARDQRAARPACCTTWSTPCTSPTASGWRRRRSACSSA